MKEKAANYIENNPSADVLMSSMRSMGYTFESAVADIVDNSISAGATEIQIKFSTDPAEQFVMICDNGYGMSREELFDAMKYGSESKKDFRSNTDLGRFGLGLKSASLSQCRKLTVMSKKNGIVSDYCWDLDVVMENKKWLMAQTELGKTSGLIRDSYLSTIENGTVVVWEDFDFIEKATKNVFAGLLNQRENVAKHLSLVFHRFLSRKGKDRVSVKINNYELEALDPFLENHKKTNVRRKIEIRMEDSSGKERIVTVQPYVLPFRKDLTDEDKKLSGGIENYRSKQGFYIYRNERLIIWGTWFNRHRDELTKYARIKVDIPNTLDDIWDIDIKKQNATIPASIRQRLIRAVDDAMDTSAKMGVDRGRKDNTDINTDYIWDRIKLRENHFTYKLNRESRIFDLIKNDVNDSVWAKIEMVLEEIEENVPWHQIYLDQSRNRIEEPDNDARLSEIEEKARILIAINNKDKLKSTSEFIEKLFKAEPFNNYLQLKEKFLEEYV